MSRARLLEFGVGGFKSFDDPVLVEYAPLTVIVGRNNSGKSSLIQSLLLLKQTLAARNDAPLHLDGPVSAFHLRELTWGWPEKGPEVEGPWFSLRWASTVDVEAALEEARHPDVSNLVRWTGLHGLAEMASIGAVTQIETQLTFQVCEVDGVTMLDQIELYCPTLVKESRPLFRLRYRQGEWTCRWRGKEADQIAVEVDHFLPYLQLDRRAVGPRHRQRAWYNAYLMLFAQPIEALKNLLIEFQFLGSTRVLPPSLYKPATVAPEEIGISGELAAQLLHRRQRDVVHYLPPLRVSDSGVTVPEHVVERPLVDAVNDVLESLSVRLPVSIDEIRDVGFRLLFGNATLQHVGRGLTYLLPLIELGLFADPLRFESIADAMTIDEYKRRCAGTHAHIAFEEAESHLHPKIQSRLAHWFVSLAMANRSLLVETHSDHLVRRLRGLAARAEAGSDLERWLIENVLILEVEQGPDGRSKVIPSRLTADGGIGEHWPTDFMDEATTEDSAIYYAGLDKSPGEAPQPLIIHDEGDEPEVER